MDWESKFDNHAVRQLVTIISFSVLIERIIQVFMTIHSIMISIRKFINHRESLGSFFWSIDQSFVRKSFHIAVHLLENNLLTQKNHNHYLILSWFPLTINHSKHQVYWLLPSIIPKLPWSQLVHDLFTASFPTIWNMIIATLKRLSMQIIWYLFSNRCGITNIHIKWGQYLFDQSIMLLLMYEITWNMDIISQTPCNQLV